MKCVCVSTRFYITSILFLVLNMVVASSMAADVKLKPFVLAQNNPGAGLETTISSVKTKLTQNGFEITGQYSPNPATTIIVISSDSLRQHAAQSRFGAFGAIQRVTVTKTDAGVQVSYTNPVYMAHAYQMKSDLANVRTRLSKTLGHVKDYGSEQGLSSDELRSYQYKWLMPYFSDRHELVAYKNQQVALQKIEATLKSNEAGVTKVYRVDLPGKEESVIGVSLSGPDNNDCSGDQYIMSRIDFKEIKSAGHLPYEIVVSKGKAYALYAEFRIAISFPDLSMMGSNSFASIMCAPGAIKTALTMAVGGSESEGE